MWSANSLSFSPPESQALKNSQAQVNATRQK
jgi:hypothetical protein